MTGGVASASVSGPTGVFLLLDGPRRREMVVSERVMEAYREDDPLFAGSGNPWREPSEEERVFTLWEFDVGCPFPVGSEAWEVQVLRCSEEWKAPRRWKMARVREPNGWPTFDGYCQSAYEALRMHGFDCVPGYVYGISTRWSVVHVKYVCPDGEEHVVAPLVEGDDPRMWLGVRAHHRIG